MNARDIKWFTGKGDNGTTSLLGNERVPKYHDQPDTCGTIDEATSALGFARACLADNEMKSVIFEIQRDLMHLMSELAATPQTAHKYRTIDSARVAWLESRIRSFSEGIDIPKSFIVPGDTLAGAALDLARTVVRRAERKSILLFHRGLMANDQILAYLNRLSSLCFVMARRADRVAGGAPAAADPDAGK